MLDQGVHTVGSPARGPLLVSDFVRVVAPSAASELFWAAEREFQGSCTKGKLELIVAAPTRS